MLESVYSIVLTLLDCKVWNEVLALSPRMADTLQQVNLNKSTPVSLRPVMLLQGVICSAWYRSMTHITSLIQLIWFCLYGGLLESFKLLTNISCTNWKELGHDAQTANLSGRRSSLWHRVQQSDMGYIDSAVMWTNCFRKFNFIYFFVISSENLIPAFVPLSPVQAKPHL